MQCISTLAEINGIEVLKIKDADNKLSDKECEKFIVDLFVSITGRHKQKKENPEIKFSDLIVVIDGFSNVYNKLSADGKDKIEVLLSQNLSNYSTAIIIADDINNLKRLNTKGWYVKSFGENGIWVGESASSQYVFSSSNHLRDDKVPGSDYGFDFLGTNCRMLKLLSGGE